MKPHTETYLEFFTGGKEGGCVTIGHIQLQGMTLIDNGDLARLRQIASCMDADPIPSNIVDVLELALRALSGPRGAKPKTQKGLEAWEAIRDLLKAAGPQKG